MDKNTVLLLIESAMNNLEAIRLLVGGEVCDHSDFMPAPDSTFGPDIQYICSDCGEPVEVEEIDGELYLKND